MSNESQNTLDVTRNELARFAEVSERTVSPNMTYRVVSHGAVAAVVGLDSRIPTPPLDSDEATELKEIQEQRANTPRVETAWTK